MLWYKYIAINIIYLYKKKTEEDEGQPLACGLADPKGKQA
jgi:hypothetical protein